MLVRVIEDTVSIEVDPTIQLADRRRNDFNLGGAPGSGRCHERIDESHAVLIPRRRGDTRKVDIPIVTVGWPSRLTVILGIHIGAKMKSRNGQMSGTIVAHQRPIRGMKNEAGPNGGISGQGINDIAHRVAVAVLLSGIRNKRRVIVLVDDFIKIRVAVHNDVWSIAEIEWWSIRIQDLDRIIFDLATRDQSVAIRYDAPRQQVSRIAEAESRERYGRKGSRRDRHRNRIQTW